MTDVLVKRYKNLPFNDREIKRYIGVKTDDRSVDALIDECKKECENAYDFSVCYSLSGVKVCDDTVIFDNFTAKSKNLAEKLKGCNSAIIFVSTVGFNIDRLIKKYANISPSKSLAISAIGSERAETLCDTFCFDMEKQFGDLRARFSAGYGDLALSYQKDIFDTLSVTKTIGVTLNDSLLMTPSKSVSAFVGIGKK